MLRLVHNVIIDPGGQEIDHQIHQREHAAADGNTDQEQPGIGHFQGGKTALHHGKRKHGMNKGSDEGQEEYGQHLGMDAGANLPFRQSHLTHDIIAPGVL